MKIAVVGAGIAGQMIIHRLMISKFNLSSLDWYSAKSFAPPCSSFSTSIVRRAGITQGVSELGDLLYASYDEFESIFNEVSAFKEAIELGTHFQQGDIDDEQFLKRYPQRSIHPLFEFQDSVVASEKAYIVYPNRLQTIIEEQFISQDYTQRFCNHLVLDVEDQAGGVQLQTAERSSRYDYVYLANGWNHESINVADAQFKNFLSGHYLEIPGNFLDHKYIENSWSLSLKNHLNLVYRKREKHILISAHNTKQLDLLGSPQDLRALYQSAQEVFPDWDWPQLVTDYFKVGVRLKGIKRHPTAKWVSPRLAVLNGLYKNGFSFSVKLSKDLVNVMGKEKR